MEYVERQGQKRDCSEMKQRQRQRIEDADNDVWLMLGGFIRYQSNVHSTSLSPRERHWSLSESIQREDNDTDPHLLILNWLTIASDEDERQEASQDSHSMYVIHVFGKGASLSLSSRSTQSIRAQGKVSPYHRINSQMYSSLVVLSLIPSLAPQKDSRTPQLFIKYSLGEDVR